MKRAAVAAMKRIGMELRCMMSNPIGMNVDTVGKRSCQQGEDAFVCHLPVDPKAFDEELRFRRRLTLILR